MRALITGVEGFVGPYLARELKASGVEVTGTFLNNPPDMDIELHQLDILDASKCDDLIADIQPNLIFHLAGFSSVKQSWEDPELCMKINVDGTRNLLEAVKKAGIDPTILIVSSSEVYGKPEKLPIAEDHPLNPVSPYAKSRLKQEELCRSYELKIIISRSFNHIGPGQLPIFVASDFAQQIADIEQGTQEPVIRTGDLKASRDFTDVRDMVKAYHLAVERCKPGTYNICSGKALKIQDILDILLGLSEKKIKVEQDTEKMRPSEIPEIYGDNTKFYVATGWKPSIPIEDTLKDILEHCRNS